MIRRRPYLLWSAMAFGYAFLYAPLMILMVYSFNESRMVSVWSGFSTRWYGELLRNERMLDAAWLSIRIAFVSASLATALGMLAGLALARYRRFRGRALLGALLAAPLVMPEVLTGLSLLLLFVGLEQWVGWPERRGFQTLSIAHATMGITYVALIVQARLADMDPSIEEAAQDLGARPFALFWRITLPMIAPALIAGWLLAFTLSLDDLVVASFVSGPGATTLPMLVFSSVRLGLSPQINALATLIVAAVAVGVIAAGWLLQRKAAR